MISPLSVFILTQLIILLPGINVYSASCKEDLECYRSGGRKCCDNDCSARKYCGNYCEYDDDCDITKRENCVGNKCTTEVRTLQPGQCRYSYQCDTLTEICYEGKCKKIEGLNEETTKIPKSDEGTNNSILPAAVIVGIIVPLLIVIVLMISVCLFLRTRRQMRQQQANQLQREMQSVIASTQRPIFPPFPSSPPLPANETFVEGEIPSQAPPSYDEAMKTAVIV